MPRRGIKVAPKYISTVKLALGRRGFTQKALAYDEDVQLSRSTVDSFLNGKSVERENFIKISDRLGLDWQKIADFDEDSEPSLPSDSQPQDLPPFNQMTIYNNLPSRDYTCFIERQEIVHLLERLSFDNPVHLIGIEGIGGVGKTTLALEAAYRCLDPVSAFEAIIFTSAKQQHLRACRIFDRLQRESTLRDIFRTIARTLNCLDTLPVDFEEQLAFIRDSLSHQRTLLIVDNLETIEEQENVLSFVLDRLPSTVKAIVTTREQTMLDVAIRLESLPEQQGVELIQHQAVQKQVQLSCQECLELYQKTCGIPVAIVYAIGQLASNYPLPRVLTRLTQASDDIARYCLQDSVTSLQGQLAHKLLMALALFPKPALKDAIANIALSAASTDDSLARLQQLSLIKYRDERYSMLPLTREYAIAQLKADPNFEREARNRWVNWYLQFSLEYGTTDWQEWNSYEQLEQEWENLQDAIEWCIVQQSYENFREFWQHIKGYTQFAGYWDERLRWTDWLIQTAQQRQDWITAAEASLDKGRTLLLINQPRYQPEAKQLFDQAWNWCDTHQLPCQFDAAIDMAVFYIHQQEPDCDRARSWLNQVAQLLEQIPLETTKRCRLQTRLPYHQGEICFKKEEYDRAKSFYEEALQQAQAIGWQRAITYSQLWLAHIAIEQEELDKADLFLTNSLPVVKSKKDKRCLAFCKRTFAFLEQARGNQEQCRNWAEQAREDFQKLGMLQEAAQMDRLIQNLKDTAR